MIYDRSSTKEKWTIMKYTSDFHLMTAYAKALRDGNSLSDKNIKEILQQMIDKGIYNPRYGGSIYTGQFKVIQLAWYMFGYYKKGTKQKRFVFTPLGEMLLNNIENQNNTAKVFLTMLFGNGFKQPFSKMQNEFNIYPFRLIFKLLRDPRLHYRLNDYELFYFVMFLKEINQEKYDILVNDILEYRKKGNLELYELFLEDEDVVAQALHEGNYFFELCHSANILKRKSDTDFKNIGTLCHGKSRSGRRAFRAYYVELNESMINFTDVLLDNYSFLEQPYKAEELEAGFETDMMIDMYNFYPPELLNELNIGDKTQHELAGLMTIINDVEKLSTNDVGGDHERFEVALEDAFNIFIDVKANLISGPGQTDVEAIYYYRDGENIKFNVEAKSRKVKLVEVNAGRLARHREINKAQYTLVISSDFTFSIKYDIKDQNICTIKAATLSNYLYNYVTKEGRNISYGYLNDLIEKKLGHDISNDVQEFIYSNFSHEIND